METLELIKFILIIKKRNKIQELVLKATLLMLICLCCQEIKAQEDLDTQKDLKVGLVLSGGGAKGFAHIGVLKVLEEVGLRVDYIGGTSMGAIIGALYASGYTSSQLDSLILSLDFNEIMQDRIPRKSKSIYQKENTEKYALTLPLRNGNIVLPSAISKGQNVFNMLSQLTEHVHMIDDFSKLPIPFFCIATNLETGDTEILEKGYLPEALRASGSFPTLLDPVIIDGKILTDGGVVNNFPVDIMRSKGVDVIIGIDVQDKLKTKGNLNSAPKILMQIVNFQMYNQIDTKRDETSLYLKPDISNYNVVSFDQAREIMDNGENVARKQLGFLKNLVSQQKKPPLKIQKISHKRNDILRIGQITISGNMNYTDEYVLGRLGLSKTDSISHSKFTEGINNLSATGNFRSIRYKFMPKSSGLDMLIDVEEEPISTYVQFGIHYDDLYKTGALLNLTSKHALFKNDVLSADLILGDNIRYNIDYFIDNGFHWSYGINTRFNNFNKSFFINPSDSTGVITREPIDYNDFTTQLFLQTTFNQNIALRLGAEHKNLHIFTENLIDNEIFKNYFEKSDYINAFASVILDSYDDKYFPKQGVFLFAEYKTYIFSSNYNNSFSPYSQLKGQLGGALSFGTKFSGHIVSEAGITIGNGDGNFDYFLGGNNQNFINNFTNFYGYEVGDLSSSAYLKSKITLRYEVFKNHYTSFTANAARAEEDLFNKGSIFANTKTGYALGYSIKSPIGPVEIKYTWSPDTELYYWFFNVGFWF